MTQALPVQNFTATGNSAPLQMQSGMMSVSGTFVGTCVVQVDVLGDGTWIGATDTGGNALSLTGPGVVNIYNGVPCPTRLNCTAYTSGTLSARLIGQ